MTKKLNYEEIQKFYDEGNSLRNIIKEFGCSMGSLTYAAEKGLLKFRNRGEAISLERKINPQKMTEETKKKISKSIKQFYEENPEKFYWRQKNKHISKPCELFKEKLRQNNIDFIEEYKVLDDRLYSADIAFPESKIIIEINGSQHYDKEGKLKPYYQERHDNIKKEGWKVYEYHYSLCYNDELCNEIIYNLRNKYNLQNYCYESYIKEIKEKYVCPTCGDKKRKESKICDRCSRKNQGIKRRKFDPKKEELDILLNEDKMTLVELSKKYGVHSNSVKKRAQKMGIYKGRQKNYSS